MKFQYDRWGDTVNEANRMESRGEIDKVNISEETYNLIKEQDEFEFHQHDSKEVKGKGLEKLYLVTKKSAFRALNKKKRPIWPLFQIQ